LRQGGGAIQERLAAQPAGDIAGLRHPPFGGGVEQVLDRAQLGAQRGYRCHQIQGSPHGPFGVFF